MGHSSIEIAYLAPNNHALCQSAWECYRAGYAGPPWNEWKRCKACDNSFGADIGGAVFCPRCGGKLVEFWPKEQVAADILSSLRQYHGVCLVAQHGAEVVGLTLGYNISLTELAKQLRLDHSVSGEALVSYQDEIVVRPDWQSQGVGRSLYIGWRDWVLANRTQTVYARTLSDPPTVVYSWYQRMGYNIFCRYPSPDKRVILRLSSQTL